MERVDEVADFFTSWEVYRCVLEADCMEHRQIYGAVHELLAQRREPYALLDLGCGDADAIARAMEGTTVATYVGIDCAAPALELAREALSGIVSEVDLQIGDLMDAIETPGEQFDVILVSFALHHFQDDEKRHFLAAARERLKPGGDLLLIDVVRKPGESREDYLDRYVSLVRTWPVDSDKQEKIVEHVTGFDYPAPIDLEPQWARDLGFNVDEFYRGATDTQVAWRMTPTSPAPAHA